MGELEAFADLEFDLTKLTTFDAVMTARFVGTLSVSTKNYMFHAFRIATYTCEQLKELDPKEQYRKAFESSDTTAFHFMNFVVNAYTDSFIKFFMIGTETVAGNGWYADDFLEDNEEFWLTEKGKNWISEQNALDKLDPLWYDWEDEEEE